MPSPAEHDKLPYRLMQILRRLNKGQTLTEEFNVNLRTIQRDVNEPSRKVVNRGVSRKLQAQKPFPVAIVNSPILTSAIENSRLSSAAPYFVDDSQRRIAIFTRD